MAARPETPKRTDRGATRVTRRASRARAARDQRPAGPERENPDLGQGRPTLQRRHAPGVERWQERSESGQSGRPARSRVRTEPRAPVRTGARVNPGPQAEKPGGESGQPGGGQKPQGDAPRQGQQNGQGGQDGPRGEGSPSGGGKTGNGGSRAGPRATPEAPRPRRVQAHAPRAQPARERRRHRRPRNQPQSDLVLRQVKDLHQERQGHARDAQGAGHDPVRVEPVRREVRQGPQDRPRRGPGDRGQAGQAPGRPTPEPQAPRPEPEQQGQHQARSATGARSPGTTSGATPRASGSSRRPSCGRGSTPTATASPARRP